MDVDLDFIAKLTDGFSGADLAELSQAVVKAALRDVRDTSYSLNLNFSMLLR